MLGYAGRILRVDLTDGKIETEPLDIELAKKYIGGMGLAMRLYLDNSKAGVDPLSPENPLVVATGPLSGTMVPTGGNGHVFASRSPATFGVGEAKSHGTFGTEMKRAGYDAIILTGKAEKPVYLWIDDDAAHVLDAKHLWGKSPAETEDALQKELGDLYVRVSSIGPAGENLVRVACILNEKTRAAGRCGLGAVMGSKKLKAIAIRGTNDVQVAKLEDLKTFIKVIHERMKGPAARKYRTLGTSENVLVLNALGVLPVNNFTHGTFQNADRISGEYLNEHFVAKIIGCNSCAMRCEHTVVVPEGPFKGTTTRMEYESLWALGPNCGIDRLDAISKAMDTCNQYGMDSISAGGIVGFAMDLYEHGMLTNQDTDGLELRFGNHEAEFALLRKIALKEGIGSVLSGGVRMAAQEIGKGAEKYANHIKGLELTGYDLRGLKTAALGFAVSFRGADHNRHGAYAPDVKGSVDRFKAEKGRGKLVREIEDMYSIIDSLIVCKFSRGTYYDGFKDLAKYYTLVTGYEVSPEELALAGERINNLGRLINIREGFSRKDDTLPYKIMNIPIPDEGVSKGAHVTQQELDLLLDDYYETRGWTKDGIPTIEKLKQLGMEDLENIVEGK
ncbi:MAG TPA: aldehyde ferredoxin oxidoreductase family protein [Candidatus Bathyarchaeia archaeon]|nr:aldehyde ferredoxin oxidoreductase family protein [Candidatus Bathyarchaeia archaeon]